MELKQKLLTSSFDFFMKYGIKSVSMDDLARSLGISKKTIYTYVDNKKSLVAETLDEFLQKDEDEVRAIVSESTDAIDCMFKLSRHILKFLRAMKPTLIFDLKKYYPTCWSKVEHKHFGFIYTVIKSNIEQGMAEGYYREDLNAEIIAKIYSAQSHAISDENLFPLDQFQRAELFEEVIKYHMRGIITENGRVRLNQHRNNSKE